MVQKKHPVSPHLVRLRNELFEQTERVLRSRKNQDSVLIGYNRLYLSCELLCRDRQQSMMSHRLFSGIWKNAELVAHDVSGEGKDLLKSFIGVFDLFEDRLKVLSRIFMYMDRTYLLNHPVKRTIKEYGSTALTDVLKEQGCWSALYNSFEDLIGSLRNGATSDGLEVEFLQRFRTPEVEKLLIKDGELFYKRAHVYVKENVSLEGRFDVSYRAYVNEVNLWKRCGMDDKFMATIQQQMADQLIIGETAEVPSLICSLFEHQKHDSLYRLNKFLSHKRLLSLFHQGYQDYAKQYVEKTIQTAGKDLLSRLMAARDVIFDTVKQHDMEIQARESFRRGITQASNSDFNKKLLRCIDSVLRSDVVDEATMNGITIVFNGIRDKEVFITGYKRLLAKRLLQTMSHYDRELQVLEQLKKEVNADLVKPLKSMVQDMTQLPLIQSHYKNETFQPVPLDARVWPETKGKVIIPGDLESHLVQFKQFYHNFRDTTANLDLRWCPPMSWMIMDAHFKEGTKQLEVSQNQGLVLLLFNDQDCLTSCEIGKKTGLEGKELQACLLSLSDKPQILCNEGERYWMNEDLKTKKQVIKARQVSQLDKEKAETSDVPDDFFVKFYIKQFVKDRCSCSHEMLFEAVRGKYTVDRVTVKRLVDSLMKEGSVERWNGLEGYKYSG